MCFCLLVHHHSALFVLQGPGWCCSVFCSGDTSKSCALLGSRIPPLSVTENVLLVSLLSEWNRRKQWSSQRFQAWDLLAWWGGFLILLVPCQSGLDSPAIYSFGESSRCYSFSSPFLPKVMVGKSEVAAPKCKTPTKKKVFALIYVHSPLILF